MDSSFGSLLKDWRGRRHMSQLDLGLNANVSSRHISFLETGRSRPSQPMVMQLCDCLQVPRSVRNVLLTAAGFAQAYRRRALDEEEMAPVRMAVAWTLERHDPYPAMAIDRHWTLVKANRTAAMLLRGIGLDEGDSLLTAMSDLERMQSIFENWQEVVQHMIVRLRTESLHLGGDPVLDAAVTKLIAGLEGHALHPTGPLPAVIPARYRAGERILSFFSTLAQFGTAEDIALAELKIEMMFPADEATRDFLNAMLTETLHPPNATHSESPPNR